MAEYTATNETNYSWSATSGNLVFDERKFITYTDDSSKTSSTRHRIKITFPKNHASNPTSYTKTLTYNDNIFHLIINQDGIGDGTLEYSAATTSVPSSVDYSVTTASIGYKVDTIRKYPDGTYVIENSETNTYQATFGENTTKNNRIITGEIQVEHNCYIYYVINQTCNGGQVTATTYSVSNISTPNVTCDVTSATITFIGHTVSHYLDGSTAETTSNESSSVTFDANVSTYSKVRSGSFTWQTETVNWKVNQGAKEKTVTATTYSVSNISTPIVEWSATTATISFMGHTIYRYNDGTTLDTPTNQHQDVTFETNTSASSIDRTGTFKWNTVDVNWTVNQGAKGRIVTSTTYSVSDILSPTVNWNVTTTAITFIGHTYCEYDDGTTSNTPSNESQNVSFAINDTEEDVERTDSFTWHTETVIWKVTQTKKSTSPYNIVLTLTGGTTITANSVSMESSIYTDLKYSSDDIKSANLYDGVLEIKASAFANCSNLESITIANSVTSIGASAFWKCSKLNNITIPDSVTSIGNEIFYECTNLEFVTLSNNISTIGYDSFYNCTKLDDIVIPNSVTEITSSAFEGCTTLSTIIIPDNVTFIGGNVFHNCTSLSSVKLGENLKNLGEKAFLGCVKLASIEMPNSITGTGEYVFSGCTNLASITFSNQLETIESGLLCQCSKINSIVIPNNITKIGSISFYQCTNLKSVTLSNKLTSINLEAFKDCTTLSNVYLNGKYYACQEKLEKALTDSSVTLGEDVFTNTNLTDCSTTSGNIILTLKDGEKVEFTSTTMSNSLYTDKEINADMIVEAEILDGVTTIDSQSFYGCSQLKTISIADSVIDIGNKAFMDCISLTNIILPTNTEFTEIMPNTFQNCTSLATITIPKYVLYYQSESFKGCTSLTTINFSNECHYIKSYAFSGCTSLEQISFPIYLNELHDGAFKDCSNLSTVIWDNCTYTCVDRLETDMSNKLYKLGEDVFANTKLAISCEPTIILTFDDGKVLEYSATLMHVNLYDETHTQLTLTNVVLTNDVREISYRAFKSANKLTNITIPNSVTSIGAEAFENCNFTSIEIPDSVTTIGNYAFEWCTELTTIKLSNNIKEISIQAFLDCSSLVTVEYKGKSYTCSNNLIEALEANGVTVGSDIFKNCLQFNRCSEAEYTYSVSSTNIIKTVNPSNTICTLELTGYTYKDDELIESTIIKESVKLTNDTTKDVSITEGSFNWNDISISYHVYQINNDSAVTYKINQYAYDYYLYSNLPETWSVSTSGQTYYNGILISTEEVYGTFQKNAISEYHLQYMKTYGQCTESAYVNWHGTITYFHTTIYDSSCVITSSLNNIKTCEYDVSVVGVYATIYVSFNNDTIDYIYRYKDIEIGENTSTKSRTFTGVLISSNISNIDYKITQNGIPEEYFNIRPVCVSTQGGHLDDANNASLAKYSTYQTGNAIFLNRLDMQGMTSSDIIISQSGSLTIQYFFIDDYAMGLVRNAGFNYWPGGYRLDSTNTLTIKGLSKTFTFVISAYIDEDNLEFIDNGLFVNKLIRIPFNGENIQMTVGTYPYTFISDYFAEGFTFDRYTYYEQNVGYSQDESYLGLCSKSPKFKNMVTSMNISNPNNALDNVIDFTISKNDSSNYREAYFQSYYICIHFIQEYESSRRIYYGKPMYSETEMDDMYHVTQDESYKYHYIFQTANSQIVDENEFTLTGTTQSTTLYMCVPKDIYNGYEATSGTATVVSNSYLWGTQSYVIISCTGNNGSFKFKLL